MIDLLQRLSIYEQKPTRLVLRELPRLNWFFASLLFLVGFGMMGFQLMPTAVVAVLMGVLVGVSSQTQYIVFDKNEGKMSVIRSRFRQNKTITTIPLEDIKMAFFYVDEEGSSQAVLILSDDMSGLSTRSRVGEDWKKEVVIAVNKFLNVDKKSLTKEDLPTL